MEEIRKSDGTPFATKNALLMTLGKKKLTDTYEAVEKDGGWVGVKKSEEVKPKKVGFKNMPTRKYIIHRTNCDPDNKNLPISITVNNIANKKVFWPGVEVELNESQIGVLKDSVEETKLDIPMESGIYESQNPMALAQSFYPNMIARRSEVTGIITMVQRTPNYIIEIVE